MSRFLAAILLLAPAICSGEDFTRKFTGLERGKSYELSVGLDGVLTLVPLEVVAVGKPGPKPPPVDPDPADPVSVARIQAIRLLTDQAIVRGGTPATAARLTALYALVSEDCSAPGKPGMPQLAPQLITMATDEIMKAAPDAAAWVEWRKGISDIVGKVPGIGTDLTATEKALDEVAEGTQLAINNRALAEPGILDGINWDFIKEFLRPIIERLLKQLIDDLLKRLP